MVVVGCNNGFVTHIDFRQGVKNIFAVMRVNEGVALLVVGHSGNGGVLGLVQTQCPGLVFGVIKTIDDGQRDINRWYLDSDRFAADGLLFFSG